MTDSREPCGSLPVTNLNASASYCHHHMAWHAIMMITHQSTNEEIKITHSERATFGPFDSWEDVEAWLIERMLDPSILTA
jgi:hypothetical protein